MERFGQLSSVSEPVARSMNFKSQELPIDTVKMLDSGSMVTSRSECLGKVLAEPSYLLMRQEFMQGEFWVSDPYLAV